MPLTRFIEPRPSDLKIVSLFRCPSQILERLQLDEGIVVHIVALVLVGLVQCRPGVDHESRDAEVVLRLGVHHVRVAEDDLPVRQHSPSAPSLTQKLYLHRVLSLSWMRQGLSVDGTSTHIAWLASELDKVLACLCDVSVWEGITTGTHSLGMVLQELNDLGQPIGGNKSTSSAWFNLGEERNHKKGNFGAVEILSSVSRPSQQRGPFKLSIRAPKASSHVGMTITQH